MPTNRRPKSVARRGRQQNPALVEYLLTGHWWSFLVPAGEDPHPPTEDVLREIWQRNREAILERYPDAWAGRYLAGQPTTLQDWEGWIQTDLDRQAVSQGYYFDAHAADRVIKFHERFLRHSKGLWAGQPFRPSRWQTYQLIMPLYGWKRPDGTRRYRQAYVEIPKKNGKSTLCSGLSLYHLVGDNEPGAEVYTAAADRQQASIIYNEAVSMVLSSPALAGRLTCQESRKFIWYLRNRSFLHALSKESKTKEGMNISCLVFDELHAQTTPDLWDTLRYGGIARRQPMLIAITTAGDERKGICWEQHEYAVKVRDGILEDLAFLPLIFGADEQRDREDPKYWTLPATWQAANPSLGETLSEADMRQDCMEAQQSPRKQVEFKRYRLNLWGYADSKWINMQKWKDCAGDGYWVPLEYAPQVTPIRLPAILQRRDAYLGVDLASTTDIAAVVVDIPLRAPGETVTRHVWIPYFFAPAENADQRERMDQVPYRRWAEQGYMELTPGTSIDYDWIRARIRQIADQVRVRLIAIDRWNSTQIQTQLADDGFEVVQFGQGFASMSAPCKDFEAAVLAGHLIHGNHPVLTWMASNVVVRQDPAGNVKPDKEKSKERIDGIVAGIMAFDCANRKQTPPRVFDGNITFV